jgi:hypothetical protein
LGAAIAMLSTSHFKIDFLILISPALNLKQDFEVFLGKDNINKLDECEQSCKIALPWTNVELGKDFFNSLELHSPSNSVRSYVNPLLCIVGRNDFTFANANIIKQCFTSSQSQLIVMDNLDHIFNNKNNVSHLASVEFAI